MRHLYMRGWWWAWLALVACVGCDAASQPEVGNSGAKGAPVGGPDHGGVAGNTRWAHTKTDTNAPAASKVRFITDYREGLERALAEKRPVLIFFTAKWCRFCAQMEQETLHDARVVRLSEEFVCVLVDADEEPELCAEFGVRAYPTVQFVLPDGGRMTRVVGWNSPEELLAHMQAALRAAANRLAGRDATLFTR